jgi:hypothetical protein
MISGRVRKNSPVIREGKEAPAVVGGRKYFYHVCGARILFEGYGIDTIIRCPNPACRAIIDLKIPKCRRCGAACDSDATLHIHERDCPGQVEHG